MAVDAGAGLPALEKEEGGEGEEEEEWAGHHLCHGVD